VRVPKFGHRKTENQTAAYELNRIKALIKLASDNASITKASKNGTKRCDKVIPSLRSIARDSESIFRKCRWEALCGDQNGGSLIQKTKYEGAMLQRHASVKRRFQPSPSSTLHASLLQ
jgi:hypothetical protein